MQGPPGPREGASSLMVNAEPCLLVGDRSWGPGWGEVHLWEGVLVGLGKSWGIFANYSFVPQVALWVEW